MFLPVLSSLGAIHGLPHGRAIFATGNAEPPEIRNGFITKVYGILTAQLLLTAAVAYPFVMTQALQKWCLTSNETVSTVTVVGTTVKLNMYFALTRWDGRFPTNYIMLFTVTLTEGLLVGVTCSEYSVISVLYAVLAAGLHVGGLIFYAITTKSDFTGMDVYVHAAMSVLMIFIVISMLVASPFMCLICGGLGILGLSFYPIYWTQMVMGKGKLRLGIDDHMLPAMQSYLMFELMFEFSSWWLQMVS